MVTIIAEIGLSHDGDIDKAQSYAVEAKKAGADYAKFQYFTDLQPELKKYELTKREWRRLRTLCKRIKIKFMCSVFSVKGFKEYEKLKPDGVKLPSGAWRDTELVKECVKSDLQLFMSLGATWPEEVTEVKDAIIMDCTSAYPAALDDLFFEYEGFSDHTEGVAAACCALGHGCEYFEKHVGKSGPDAGMSMSFGQFAGYCDTLRKLDASLSKEFRTVHESEKFVRKILEERFKCE